MADLAGPVVRREHGEGRLDRLAGDVGPRHPLAVADVPSASVTRTTRFSLTDRSNEACFTTFFRGTATR